MFFFIGGVQPKTVTVDDTPRMCPNCGLALARLKRTDHYIMIFFIPLLPIKKGQPFLHCSRCSGIFDESGRDMLGGPISGRRCPRCGRELESDFTYCPYCGASV